MNSLLLITPQAIHHPHQIIVEVLTHKVIIRTLTLYDLEEVEVVAIVMTPTPMMTILTIQIVIGVIQMMTQMMTIAMKIIITVLSLLNLGKEETRLFKLSIDPADTREC